MGFSLRDSIVKYLNTVSEQDTFRFVPSTEIQAHLKSAYPYDSWESSEYFNAIRYLKNKGYIEEEAEHYRIQPEGVDYFDAIVHPPLNYGAIQAKKADIGNLIAIVSILVAIFGTIFAYSASRASSNSPFPNLPEFLPISLSGMIDENSRPVAFSKFQNFFDRIPNSDSIKGPFEVSTDSAILETGSSNSKNPYLVYLPVDVQGIRKIHLLINLSYASSKLVKGEIIEGKVICRVHLISENNKHVQIDLIAGEDLRDWVVGNKDVVNEVGGHVKTVWTAQQRNTTLKAVIDYLILDVPESMRQERIKTIIIDDRSWEILANINPGIVVFGLTLEK